MTQKSPVYGIYIFISVFIFIICAIAGLLGPSVFFWGALASIIAPAVLVAAKRYLLMAGSLALGSIAALLSGGGAGLVVLLTLLPTGLVIGLMIRFGWIQKEGTAAGAIIFALTALASLLLVTYNVTGGISSENIARLVKEFLDALAPPLQQVYEVQNIDIDKFKAFFDSFKLFFSLNFIGIAGAVGVVLSFLASMLAVICVSYEKGVRIKSDSFRLSRVSGIVALLVYVVFFTSTGYTQLVASNFIFILTPIFFFSGCAFIYAAVRQGTLFRSPFLFYGILFCFVFLNIIPTFTCIGIYYALAINWSKLRPQDNDGDDL